jgi:hypothetical protein
MNRIAGLAGFAFYLGILCCITIFPILAIFRRTRSVAGWGYIASGWVFGASLWTMCLLTVFDAWGAVATAIGVLLVGVGVIPMALIVLSISGQWSLFAEVLIIGAAALGIMMLGSWLLGKAK